MNKIAIIILLFWTTSLVYSQPIDRKRFEFEIDEKLGEDYKVIPAEEHGVLCLLKSKKALKGGNRELQFTFLNANLEKVWEKVHPTKSTTQLVAYSLEDEIVYILTSEKEFDYEILTVDLRTGLLSIITYQNLRHFDITHFEVANGVFYFGGVVKGHPGVLSYNHRKQHLQVFPSIHQLDADLEEMNVDKAKGLVTVLLKGSLIPGRKTLFINRYDLEGKSLGNSPYLIDRKVNLLTYRPFTKSAEELLIFGTYSLRNDDKAQGIYVLKSQQLSEEKERIRYYDFGYLSNYFKYLKPNQREKIERKIAKRRAKDKIYKLSSDLFVHELQETEDRIILLAESYEGVRDSHSPMQSYSLNRYYRSMLDPMYYLHRPSYSSYDNYYGEYMPTRLAEMDLSPGKNRPDKFEYVHGIACGFDKEGRLLWDNSYKFQEDTEFELPLESLQVYSRDDSVVFIQPQETVLAYTVTSGSIYADSVHTLPTIIEEEESEYWEFGGVFKWFENHYLTVGIQEVKNTVIKDKSREVFYISKLSYNPKVVSE
ncbi:hypothetical protein AAG747_19960 [Rapidithrix thailandica]|uniref:Uncharacterized protein n=1 Tax=Rapidithrix thailandica TaxID=413964 RepID=A0AAW9SHN7_9BACT